MSAVMFTVYGVAAPAGSKKALPYRGKPGGRPIIVDDSKRSRPWKTLVGQVAGGAMTGRPLLEGPLLLELTFYVARPKGHFGSGRNASTIRSGAPEAPIVKPDLLKLARAVEDALSGVCYRDDAQITVEVLQKRYTTTSARTQVRVAEVSAQPERLGDVEGLA